MRPKRIQRKRTKGWKKPPNTVYVGRGTKWGNPFKLVGDMIYCDASHRRKILSPWVIYDNDRLYSREEGIQKVVGLYRQWLNGIVKGNGIMRPPPHSVSLRIKEELKGKNLMCWCKESDPCHADILIEIANEE